MIGLFRRWLLRREGSREFVAQSKAVWRQLASFPADDRNQDDDGADDV